MPAGEAKQLSPGKSMLETTTIGSTWKVTGRKDLQWFKVNRRRFGYTISCEKGQKNNKTSSGSILSAEIRNIK